MIDHIIYGVPDLDWGIQFLQRRLGVRAQKGGRHLNLGTHNALIGLGADCYLEIVAPDPGQADVKSRPYGITLDMTPRVLGWAVRVTDIENDVRAARACGFDFGQVSPARRTKPNGDLLAWESTQISSDVGPPFLIDWGNSRHPARDLVLSVTLESFTIAHPEPEEVSALLVLLGLSDRVALEQRTDPGLAAILTGPRGEFRLS